MNLKNIQTEIDAAFLYNKLATHEDDPVIANVFRQMSEIENSHAVAFAAKEKIDASLLPKPSWRAKTLNLIGKVFGYDYVLGALMDTEKSISNAIVQTKKKKNEAITGTETTHVKILRSILEKEVEVSGKQISRFEKRHRSVGGNAIRAAVLGGNDGLVSNFSLVMGIAGATQGQQGVLLAGLAGLLAGALSMALGEWISVKSSQELYERQMALEMEEIENDPETETKELQLIYMAKGIPAEQLVFNAVSTIPLYQQNYTSNGTYAGQTFTGYQLSQTLVIESKEVEKVEKISREITELLNQGITFYSMPPRYYYTKLESLKLEMIAKATEDGRIRAERIAENSNSSLGDLVTANMGIFQITGQNSGEDYSWGGTFNTSAKNKTASITMKLSFEVD